jgi:signal peptidase I
LPSASAVRETIESIVIAFVLAFLFRTFEAEAFVIPTGSMAPTLMGRHKDVVCPKCGFAYRVGASEEVDPETEAPRPSDYEVTACTCPLCRYTAHLDSDFDLKDYPHREPPSYSYPGDRLLVDKLAFEFLEPERWDVVVFRYPNSAWRNYIKRLVGLPGETVKIQYGDVWIRNDSLGETDFHIARKRPQKILAMLQPVFDNDYMPRIAEFGWPERWTADEDEGSWKKGPDGDFLNDGRGAGPHWLRYRHRIPSAGDWDRLKRGPEWERCYGPDAKPTAADWQALKEAGRSVAAGRQPHLITDFTAFDTSWSSETPWPSQSPPTGFHWVGDLAVGCTADVEGQSGGLAFELRKGGRHFQCRIDVATGNATLSIDSQPEWRPTAATAVRGRGVHDILFSNCDDELRLWVDGRVVEFPPVHGNRPDHPTAYRDDLDNHAPDEGDLAPAGVAADGARLRISHLRVLRDIYYIATDWKTGGMMDYQDRVRPDELLQYSPAQRRKIVGRWVEFSLAKGRDDKGRDEPGKDQFFMLGDNSSNSQDSRLWVQDAWRLGRSGSEFYVDRDLLIGKAFFLYWPHSWNEIPTPWGNLPCPYFPNVRRMRFVR